VQLVSKAGNEIDASAECRLNGLDQEIKMANELHLRVLLTNGLLFCSLIAET
jgi:hypothetical protein